MADIQRFVKHWDRYRAEVIPRPASVLQVRESKRAFYAGAYGLLCEILTMLDPGTEPTAADMKKMDEILRELTDFAAKVAAGED